MAFCVVFLWQTSYWVRVLAVTELREQKAHTLDLVVENLRGSLLKFQYKAALISRNSLFRRALLPGASRAEIQAANLDLERSNFLSGALDTFLLDRDGKFIAGSNWTTPQSYRDLNARAAPYFRAALQGRLGRYFAMDRTPETQEIGYYFAYPVRDNTEIVGVAVVKMRLEPLAERWLAPDHETMVVDENGVIFMSSQSVWRFHSLRPLGDEVKSRLRQTRRYGDRPLTAISATWDKEDDRVVFSGDAGKSYLLLQKTMTEVGWRVINLTRLDSVWQQQAIALAIASFVLVSVFLILAVAYQRKLRHQERISLQAAAQIALTTEVAERTRDLTEANSQLRQEIGERERAETELKKTQNELVQATKFAALGQMSAGLSHELNQPLAAIRSYADNAQAFLKRAEPKSVQKNLGSIAELTDRMARIIRNLRIYSRNEPIETRPTSLKKALTDSLAILDDPLKEQGVDLQLSLPDTDLIVEAGEVRLQQVFINIISNAIDAVKEGPKKSILIDVEQQAKTVVVSVRDTGSGLPDAGKDKIFDPFFSTKEVGEGLGLGLSISYGIVNQFGGHIEATAHPDGGSVFSVTLKRPEAVREAAE